MIATRKPWQMTNEWGKRLPYSSDVRSAAREILRRYPGWTRKQAIQEAWEICMTQLNGYRNRGTYDQG